MEYYLSTIDDIKSQMLSRSRALLVEPSQNVQVNPCKNKSICWRIERALSSNCVTQTSDKSFPSAFNGS